MVRSPYLLGTCAFLFAYSPLSTFLYFQQAELVPAAIPDRRTLPRGELADEVRDAAKLRSPTTGGMPASRIEGLARHWNELARGL